MQQYGFNLLNQSARLNLELDSIADKVSQIVSAPSISECPASCRSCVYEVTSSETITCQPNECDGNRAVDDTNGNCIGNECGGNRAVDEDNGDCKGNECNLVKGPQSF